MTSLLLPPRYRKPTRDNFGLDDLLLLGPSSLPPVPLTLSGNELTPATRAAGTQGDGLTGPYQGSSIGVWQATTNLVTNGGFETNTTGWSNPGSLLSTFERSSDVAKFGSYSLKCVHPGGGGDRRAQFAITLSASTVYTVSCWYFSTAAKDVLLQVTDGVDLTVDSGTVAIAANTWTRVSVLVTTDAHTSWFVKPYFDANGGTFYIDGVQVEAQPIPTPYVETDGGTASRSASNGLRVRPVSQFLSATQGWAVARMRMGWAAGTPPASTNFMGSWGVDGNNRIFIYFASGNWFCRRISGGTSGLAQLADSDFVEGTEVTVIGAWNATTMYVSVDGSTFATGAQSTIPDLSTQPYFSFGWDDGANNQIDSPILFAALGKGTLSNANAAAIHQIARNNRINSRIEDLPGGCTFKWPSENWREGMAL